MHTRVSNVLIVVHSSRGGECWSLPTPPLSLRACAPHTLRIHTSYAPHTQVSAGALRVLLRFLYAHALPDEEDYTKEKIVGGVTAGEMFKIADLFQAKELYEHSLAQFRAQLCVRNAILSLVAAYDDGLDVLTQSVFDCVLQESVAIQTQALQSLDVFLDRLDLMPLAVKLLKVFGGPSI